MSVSYEQAYSDWEYLFSIGTAYDMTGGYVDQEDLKRLLKSPTKKTARDCLVEQIRYWFQVGIDAAARDSYEFCHLVSDRNWNSIAPLLDVDERIKEIHERYNITIID